MSDDDLEGQAAPQKPGVIAGLAVLGVVVILAALVGTFLAIRAMTGNTQESRPVIPPSSVERPKALSIVDEAAVVAEALRTADAPWSQRLTRVEVATRLLRPVVVVWTDVTAEEADVAEALRSEVDSFLATLARPDIQQVTYCVRLLSAEGEVLGTVARTDERWALQTPPAPVDAAGLRAWLEEVYGGATSESWLPRILDITGPDGAGVLLVRTDLDPGVPIDLLEAQTIIDAVDSSGATFAASIRVVFADGAFAWESLLSGKDPYLQQP